MLIGVRVYADRSEGYLLALALQAMMGHRFIVICRLARKMLGRLCRCIGCSNLNARRDRYDSQGKKSAFMEDFSLHGPITRRWFKLGTADFPQNMRIVGPRRACGFRSALDEP